MKLITYLFFNGTAEAAFDFYAKCLGGKIAMLSRYKEAPGCEHMPPEDQQRVMHVRLEVGDQTLMASDSHPDIPYTDISGCSISIQVDTAVEAERLFNALKEGGQVNMEMGETFFSKRFGMLVDKFGAEWMINCEKGAG